jgi:hypothetical protein
MSGDVAGKRRFANPNGTAHFDSFQRAAVKEAIDKAGAHAKLPSRCADSDVGCGVF